MTRRQRFLQLAGHSPTVAPSLLAADFAALKDELAAIEAAGGRLIHLDIMDGHFVPNISFGVPVVESVRAVTDLPLDTHLMIEWPDRYIEAFFEAGSDCITIHVEACEHVERTLDRIRKLGAAAGITARPRTPLKDWEAYLPHCDLALVMSVEPGFGGQEFLPGALGVMKRIRQIADHELLLEVDGGINRETAGPCIDAGADLLVAGTAVFSADNYAQAMNELLRNR